YVASISVSQCPRMSARVCVSQVLGRREQRRSAQSPWIKTAERHAEQANGACLGKRTSNPQCPLAAMGEVVERSDSARLWINPTIGPRSPFSNGQKPGGSTQRSGRKISDKTEWSSGYQHKDIKHK